ncbi:MAG TPA: MarR family winged helix-turn-helix transcriptional regulator [Rhizomicrobium sp.]|nr:MarR family winged helix-turn-helix transcriptional regulator [Rhizomicrobium sp.]
MTSKGPRKANGSFELAESPAHLMRLCQQYYGDLYARETGARDLTKQQFTLLCALEHNDGVSQTHLVETTGIDRSTLAEMVRRMRERGLLSRERTEEDMRANAVAITQGGRKALKSARQAAERAERMFLEALPPPDRQKFVRLLAAIAAAGEQLEGDAAPRARRKPLRRQRN